MRFPIRLPLPASAVSLPPGARISAHGIQAVVSGRGQPSYESLQTL